MALPSARRPPELEEELEELQQTYCDNSRFCLKFKINAADIFMAMMVSWCEKKMKEKEEEYMERKEQSNEMHEIKHLAKREIIRQARRICGTFKIDYSALPVTWLKELHEGHGVDFTYKSAMDKAKKKAEKALREAAKRRDITLKEMHVKADLLRNSTITADAIIEELELIKEKYDNAPSSRYRFQDLTNEPPPPFWTEEYSKNIHLPRTLKIVTLEGKRLIVAYYDYSRTLALSVPTGYQSKCHEANNFLSVS